MEVSFLTATDLSEKNGQSIYAYYTLMSILECDELYVHLYCPKPKSESILEQLSNQYNFSYKIIHTEKRRMNFLWHITFQLLLLKELLLAKSKNISALIYSLKPYFVAPLLYSFFYKVPIFLFIEGLSEKQAEKFFNSKPIRSLLVFIIRSQVKRASRLYPAYSECKEWTDRIRNDNKSTILTSCADPNIFVPVNSRSRNQNLVIGYVGSFKKDVHLLEELIEASFNINITIKLLGEGNDKEYLQSKVFSESMNKNIHFLSPQPQENLPSFFAECDVMWGATNPNHWAIPIKCFEYLACNKKIIYTEKPELSFVYKLGYGFPLKEGTIPEIEELLSNLNHVFHLENLKDNETSRDYIIRNHTWSIYGKTLVNDMKELSVI